MLTSDVLRQIGEYNQARIVACGSRVEHWLNGVRVARYDTDSDEWRRRVFASGQHEAIASAASAEPAVQRTSAL